MTQKPSYSAIKRVFFAPVDHQKFLELKERQQQEMAKAGLFSIR